MKPKILIVTQYYLPFVKGGGPIQSIKNIVENLSDKYDFYIITNCCDHGDKLPSNEVIQEKWQKVGQANVYYISAEHLTIKKIEEISKERIYHKIYLNSFFSWPYSIKWMFALKHIRERRRFIIAPRGEFSQGALHLKRVKKSIFYNIARASCLYKNTLWQATSKMEKKDIIRIMGNMEVVIASNLLDKSVLSIKRETVDKKTNSLRIVFLSRVHPKKNLEFSLELLKAIEGNVIYDIYGPIEDKPYWERCQGLIKELPSNILVRYKGILNHDNVNRVLKEYHVFLFPTLGENFGHVIAEAFMAGIPVITSNETPWKNLKQLGVGYDIPLIRRDEYIAAINFYKNMNQKQYNELVVHICEFIEDKINQKQDIIETEKMFS